MKKIFASPDSAEMGLLKGMLDEAGIPCMIRNEQTSQAMPSPAFYAELCVMNDEDFARANEIFQAWRHPSPVSRQMWICPNCGEKLEGQFAACWKCGTERESPLSSAS